MGVTIGHKKLSRFQEHGLQEFGAELLYTRIMYCLKDPYNSWYRRITQNQL